MQKQKQDLTLRSFCDSKSETVQNFSFKILLFFPFLIRGHCFKKDHTQQELYKLWCFNAVETEETWISERNF